MRTRNDKQRTSSDQQQESTDDMSPRNHCSTADNDKVGNTAPSRATSHRARRSSGRADATSTDEDVSGECLTDCESAATQAGTAARSGRKRQLPARFRDTSVDLQPSPRRRRVSSAVPDTATTDTLQPAGVDSAQLSEQYVHEQDIDEDTAELQLPQDQVDEDQIKVEEECVVAHVDTADDDDVADGDDCDDGTDHVSVLPSSSDSNNNNNDDEDSSHCHLTGRATNGTHSHHNEQYVLPDEHQHQEADDQHHVRQEEQVVVVQQHDDEDEDDALLLPEPVVQHQQSHTVDTQADVLCAVADPLAAATGVFFASDDDELAVGGRASVAVTMVPSSELDDDDDLIAMEVESLDVPLPCHEEPREACKVCHRQMKVSQLRQHMLLHAGLRPFKCEVCQAAFTRRSDVFRHVNIVHRQEKPFKCALDGKEFSDRQSLKLHMEQHKRPVLFACKVCDFRFGKFDSYVNHIKNIHPTGEPLPSFPEEVEPAPEPLAPPRGRHGPKPLEEFIDDDCGEEIITSPCGGVVVAGGTVGVGADYLDATVIGDRLDMSSAAAAAAVGLENIETEEIPHDSMQQLVVGDVDVSSSSAVLQRSGMHDDETAHSFCVVSATNGETSSSSATVVDVGSSSAAVAVTSHEHGHMSMPSLDDDAASILGDLCLPAAGVTTGACGDAATSVSQQQHCVPSVGRSVSVTSSLRRGPAHVASRHVQPRVVTIGKSCGAASGVGVQSELSGGMAVAPATAASSASVGGGGPFKTVLLTRPRMVAGRQVLQAVKLSPGQRIVAARVPAVSCSSSAAVSSVSSPVSSATVSGRSTSGSVVRTAHMLNTASPAVLPRVKPVLSHEQQRAGAAACTDSQTGSRSIEVTTSTAAGGSRTIVLQTNCSSAAGGGENDGTGAGGAGDDILQSKEAMQSLLSAVQELVTASGDTLEGKQIEIVMQNDQQTPHN